MAYWVPYAAVLNVLEFATRDMTASMYCGALNDSHTLWPGYLTVHDSPGVLHREVSWRRSPGESRVN